MLQPATQPHQILKQIELGYRLYFSILFVIFLLAHSNPKEVIMVCFLSASTIKFNSGTALLNNVTDSLISSENCCSTSDLSNPTFVRNSFFSSEEILFVTNLANRLSDFVSEILTFSLLISIKKSWKFLFSTNFFTISSFSNNKCTG